MNRAIRILVRSGRIHNSCIHFIIIPSGLFGLLLLMGCGEVDSGRLGTIHRPPTVRPDFASTVIPPNIAPLNFRIEERGDRYRVIMHSDAGGPIRIFSRSASIKIPAKPWKKLLSANRGRELVYEISVRNAGEWQGLEAIRLRIAHEKIDETLVYRLIKPVFNLWKDMGIYQRNLESFEEKALLRNTLLSNCINCHSFCNHSSSQWSLQMRFSPGGLLLVRNDTVTNVSSRTSMSPFPAAYTAWHPGGKVIAFSVDQVAQFFHAKGENRDVIDLSSDLMLYRPDSDSMSTSAKIASPDRMETLPDWSPDGKTLYFCSAPRLDPAFSVREDYSKIRYDLMRIPYDIRENTFGDPEIVLSSAEMNKSLSHPKVSPDGRFLLFSMADYGYFTIYRKESDLGLLDLRTREIHPLPVNSAFCESYHSWSSNSRWFVFSSKRDDGICARPYFAYVDEAGQAYKPFMLPQEDASFYDDYWITYNVPELVSGRVPVRERTLIRAAIQIEKIVDAKPFSESGKEPPSDPASTDAREWQKKL
jgi:hypothetical protein